MNYRILPPEEWPRLKDLIGDLGTIPPPETAVVAVAENDEGQLSGCLFLQLALHMEPLVIAPDARGQVNFLRLTRLLESSITGQLSNGNLVGYYVHATQGTTASMAELNGMKLTNCLLYEKIIGKE